MRSPTFTLVQHRGDHSHAVSLLDAGLLHWDELLPSQVDVAMWLACPDVSFTGLPLPFSLPLVR